MADDKSAMRIWSGSCWLIWSWKKKSRRESGATAGRGTVCRSACFWERGLSEGADSRGLGWTRLERLLRDFRYALRQLARSPGFAAAAILTLALGIGASTSIFSVADAVLLRPLPYPNPGQLVRVWEQMPNGHRPNLAESNFEDFLTQNNTFASLAAYDYGTSSVSGGSEPARVNVCGCLQRLFPDSRCPAAAWPSLCGRRTPTAWHASNDCQLWVLAALPWERDGSIEGALGSRRRILPGGRGHAAGF